MNMQKKINKSGAFVPTLDVERTNKKIKKK